MTPGLRLPWNLFLAFALLWILSTAGCSSTDRVALEPATIQSHDVFTCKGLTVDRRWVGVTDVFMPKDDPQVVVVASFTREDQESRVIYELTNPLDAVVLSEPRTYPKQKILGIAFPMDRLMKLGGEGEWRATVYSDGIPIGDSIFYLGEKPEKEEEVKIPFAVVGESSLEEAAAPPLSEEEKYAKSIQEVSPELSIPISAPALSPVTPASATTGKP